VARSNTSLILRFTPADGGTFHVSLECAGKGECTAVFTAPYTPATWAAILRALEPDFDLAQADAATRAALKPFEPLGRLPHTAGRALADALFASDDLRAAFDAALREAEAARQPLPVELRFDDGCDALAALPWELLYHEGRFLVADSSICLSRCPVDAAPPTPALADLPLRVLLVLSEPLDASPILPQRAREQLVHGLRALD
jgi:hypothetical protein